MPIVSTAAGALQINYPTWLLLRGRHPGELPDFSPGSQDHAGELLIGDQPGAMAAVLRGDLAAAIPAVMAYNKFATEFGLYAGRMQTLISTCGGRMVKQTRPEGR